MTDAKGRLEFIAGLIPLSPTGFYFPFRGGKVTFTLDENGRAVKVDLRYRGEDHFRRAAADRSRPVRGRASCNERVSAEKKPRNLS
jgi:hypothetical protein